MMRIVKILISIAKGRDLDLQIICGIGVVISAVVSVLFYLIFSVKAFFMFIEGCLIFTIIKIALIASLFFTTTKGHNAHNSKQNYLFHSSVLNCKNTTFS